MKETCHLGWVRFTDPAHRIAVCREELWLGMEKTNPVTVTGTRMGWLLDSTGPRPPPTRPRALRSAGSGCSKMFEEWDDRPDHRTEPAILARLHGQSAH